MEEKDQVEIINNSETLFKPVLQYRGSFTMRAAKMYSGLCCKVLLQMEENFLNGGPGFIFTM